MQRRDRVRQTAILCCKFLRNLAFYRVGWTRTQLRRDDQFWRTVNGNFLDLCVLEWCKLFAGKNNKHHWRKVVAHPDRFEVALLARLHLTKQQFDEYITAMCAYRDKFVAHLDDLPVMQIPHLRLARRSVACLYDHLISNPDDMQHFDDHPLRARRYYLLHMNLGRTGYAV